MSKITRWLTLLLAIIMLTLIGWNIADVNNDTTLHTTNNKTPTYQSQCTNTVVYDSNGQLSYKLIAKNMQYYATSKITWFTEPVVILFNKNTLATWSIYADRAKLTNHHRLYLYGHVKVNSLIASLQLKKIKTDNAQVNLRTQDVSSNDKVIFYGTHFTSSGMKMHGNLREKTAELINKVQTTYEIKNQ
ncbi:LPS export ABC transporter periplasmic protein LptC [Candidatus Gillettellia adelgis]